MNSSKRLNLPLLLLHQSLKELSINEMIQEIDCLIANPILDVLSKLPDSPEEDGIYLIYGSSEEELIGKNNHLALWINNRWKFIEPRKYMTFYSLKHSKNLVYNHNSWNL